MTDKTAENQKKVVDTRTAVALKHPFLASHLYQATSVEYDPKASTAYTDGSKIGMGDWVCDLPLEQRMYVLAHEVVHDMLRHIPRRELYRKRQLGPDMTAFDQQRFDKAADYVVNAVVDELGCGRMPEGGLRDPSVTPDTPVDEVYRTVEGSTDDDQQAGDQGAGHGGFDEHREPDDNSSDGTDSSGDGEQDSPESGSVGGQDAQQLDEEAKRNIASAMNAAKQAGNMPGGLERALRGMLEPERNWVDELRDYITRQAGSDETSWAKPHRRRIMMPPHIPYPGTDGHTMNCLVVALDVSGSINERELSIFTSELRSIIEQVRPRETHLLAWDTQARHYEIESAEDLEDIAVTGGGGTDYGCIPDMIQREDLQPDAVVSFTDGMVRWPSGESFDCPHITVHTTSEFKAPFGTNIYMDPHKQRNAA